MTRIPSLIRSCSKEGINPVREIAGFGAGVVAVLVVLAANAWAMPSGPALSPYGSSPQAVSPASPLQSLSQGDAK